MLILLMLNAYFLSSQKKRSNLRSEINLKLKDYSIVELQNVMKDSIKTIIYISLQNQFYLLIHSMLLILIYLITIKLVI